jgi:hypothetical protein
VNTFERWTLRIGFGLAATSGVLYGYLRYFGGTTGEFGQEPHPWQAFAQHAHVLAAPALLFALGVAVRGHLLAMLRHSVTRGRRTGLLLAALSAPMVLGGLAIQVVTSGLARNVFGYSHTAVGLLFAVLVGLHWAKPRPSKVSPRSKSVSTDSQLATAALPGTLKGGHLVPHLNSAEAAAQSGETRARP